MRLREGPRHKELILIAVASSSPKKGLSGCAEMGSLVVVDVAVVGLRSRSDQSRVGGKSLTWIKHGRDGGGTRSVCPLCLIQ